MKKSTVLMLSVFIALTFSTVNAFTKAKPTVIIIRAEWCSACQKVEPIMDALKKDYGSKMNFVVFDVTNEETTEKAAAKAKSLGLSSFFESNKRNTSTVAVFKGSTQSYKTSMNYNKSEYVTAFNKALK